MRASTRRRLFPKRLDLLAATAVLGALCAGAFVAATLRAPWSPKRGLGLVFGIAAAVCFVVAMAYPARRPRARPLRNAEDWFQAHVYLGLLGMVLTLVHAGFAWPAGEMGWALLLASGFTTLAGLGGAFLQKALPAAAAEGLRVYAMHDRIPGLVADTRTQAEQAIEGAGEALQGLWEERLAPRFAGPEPRWSYLIDVRAGREDDLSPLRRLAPFVEAEDRERIDRLIVLFTTKLELDAQLRLQRVLRAWLAWHVYPGAALLGLLVLHVLGFLVY
jgi:hypothetical protein